MLAHMEQIVDRMLMANDGGTMLQERESVLFLSNPS